LKQLNLKALSFVATVVAAMSADSIVKIALLWPGTRQMRSDATPENNRLRPLFEALSRLGTDPEPAVYSDEFADEVRDQLVRADGVLVWVDPISAIGNRTGLDAMLREVALAGVYVSAHPDVILKIGTKEVLFRTKHLGWGADTYLYESFEQFREQFPARLGAAGPRVLKQDRGNGGIGTWKVDLLRGDRESPHADEMVHVQEARMGSPKEELRLGDFMNRCEGYFTLSGRLIDQGYEPRAAEGMVRCYLVHNRVVGFSTQQARGEAQFGMIRHKSMYEESEAQFQTLRAKMESEWVPAIQHLFEIDTNSLPVLWDADFLYGPKTARGEDTYVLCEINVSAVFPFPESALPKIAEATAARVFAAKEARTDG
jgi:hypothetical protein